VGTCFYSRRWPAGQELCLLIASLAEGLNGWAVARSCTGRDAGRRAGGVVGRAGVWEIACSTEDHFVNWWVSCFGFG